MLQFALYIGPHATAATVLYLMASNVMYIENLGFHIYISFPSAIRIALFCDGMDRSSCCCIHGKERKPFLLHLAMETGQAMGTAAARRGGPFFI